jgi:nicotinamide mononucleotide adenylyltransferase
MKANENLELYEAVSKDFNYSADPLKNWKNVVIAPGRFQPIHAGHEDMIRELVSFAKRLKAEPVVVIIEGSSKSEKNPLSGASRKKFLSPVFKGIKVVLADNPFAATEEFFKKGIQPVGLVAGSDRVQGYKRLGEFYHIEDFQVKGLKRDPDTTGSASFSATDVREKVKEGDLKGFLKMMPKKMTDRAAQQMFKELSKVLKGPGVK